MSESAVQEDLKLVEMTAAVPNAADGIVSHGSMSLSEDSPAKTSVIQGSWQGSTANGQGSGLKWSELFASFDPNYVVVENVDGLLARGMGIVLGDLAKAGYDAEWACLSARDFGAPHERDRVFLVAYPYASNGAARVGNLEDWPRPIFAGDYPERDAFWLQATREAVGVADGLPARLYKPRVEGLGNAIVPQIAEWIARQILVTEGRTPA